MSKLLTIKEASQLLRTHEMILYRMTNEGRVPAFKVGKQWRFDKEKILKSLECQQKAIRKKG